MIDTIVSVLASIGLVVLFIAALAIFARLLVVTPLLALTAPRLRERYKSDRRVWLAVNGASALLGVGAFLALILFWFQPRFERTYQRVYAVSLKADLMNLLDAEQEFFDEHGAFTTHLDSLGFTPSERVRLLVDLVSDSGGVARATMASVRSECALAWGGARNPLDSLAPDGKPRCLLRYGRRIDLY